MKPDSHMPFYGNDFFQAVRGYGEAFTTRYLKALWHNWSHLDCAGLPNDDTYLQNVCECPIADWARTKGVLFGDGRFFTLGGDNTWHQKKQDELYANITRIYNIRVGTAANARQAKGDSTNVDTNVDTNVICGSNLDPKPKPKPYLKPDPKLKSEKDIGANGSHPASNICDEVWLATLETGDAYKGINVREQYGRMVNWCGVNNKQPSRRRFINWLNRTERPMSASASQRKGPNSGEVIAFIKEKAPNHPDCEKWAYSFLSYWNRRKWERNANPIDWREELSKQIAKWRSETQPEGVVT